MARLYSYADQIIQLAQIHLSRTAPTGLLQNLPVVCFGNRE